MDLLSAQFLDAMTAFSYFERKKRNFGTPYFFSLTEIHIIAYIGTHPNCLANDLVGYFSITKGAVSQIIRKLSKEQMLQYSISPTNRTRHPLCLTKEGMVAFYRHRQFHAEINNWIADSIGSFTKEQTKAIFEFLQKIEQNCMDRSYEQNTSEKDTDLR